MSGDRQHKSQKLRNKIALVTCLLLFTLSCETSWAIKFTVNARILSRIEFETPGAAKDRNYLGIPGSLVFRLPQIQADVLIIEIFNMYCHYCQKEAPNVNKLYAIIERDPALKGRVKLIGIGAGNTPYEVNLFKKRFKVGFPLLPDPEVAIQKTSKSKFRTPTFLVARKVEGPALEIVQVHIGKLGPLRQFLNSFMSR